MSILLTIAIAILLAIGTFHVMGSLTGGLDESHRLFSRAFFAEWRDWWKLAAIVLAFWLVVCLAVYGVIRWAF